jgi:ribosomal protein S13
MFITELAEAQLLVIYPGRFQPFHKGHYAVYEYLTGKFGRNNVYIATSNKTDNSKSPFTFAEKAYFMQLTGVPADRIVQATQPYQIQSILSTGQISVANPENTVVIFAVSEKDMAEDPRFSFATKKDGSTPYFQPLKDIKQTESMDRHGYIMTVPTFDFTVAGAPMRSGTELRKLYSDADPKQRQAIIADLFGKYTSDAEHIMNNKISPTVAEPAEQPRLPNKTKLQKVTVPKEEPVAEAVNHFVPTQPTNKSNHGYYKLLAYRYKKDPRLLSAKEKQELHDFVNSLKTVKECGGTGVVATKKQARDPRYSTSLTKDVQPGAIKKSLRAFNLAEEDIAWAQNRLSESEFDNLILSHIKYINQDIDAIKERIATEKLPADYVAKLKQKIHEDINSFISMNSVKGFRHRSKLPVRGQRTHSNAKTCKKISKI